MTSAIVSAINILTKPLRESSLHDAPSSHQQALSGALRANRAFLLEQLQREPSFEVVRMLREEVMEEADWFSSSTDDAAWDFAQECLLLLLTLARHLSAELRVFQQTPAASALKYCTPENAPPLPPDVLSVTQQKMLGTALQFVVSLGLCPYLAPGVGVPLGHRSTFAAMVEKLVCNGAVTGVGCRLLTTTKVLLQLTELSSLATLVFTRHLGDVMAALCQLGYQPHQKERSGTKEQKDISAEERQTCREALKSLVGKVYQPIVIKELLILQGGPKQSGAKRTSSGSNSRAALGSAPAWLRHVCGQLLSKRLMQPNGVQAVVRAILGGGKGDESDWRKCESVARILVTCPQQSTSIESYYRDVCPQILDLLHFKDKLTAQQFQRVATRAVLLMVQERPSFAQQYLLTPLFSPLHRCTTTSGKDHSSASVEEWELTRCLEDMYKICVVGNSPSDTFLKALEQVLPILFTLFCFTKQNVSHLRAPCQEILLWYLRCTEKCAALSALWQLSGLQGENNKLAAVLCFSPGSDGGARPFSRESCSNEDDALYEKLSEEQWRLECLMQLLVELKDSDLPGDFFLDLLQLTSWAAAEDEDIEDEQQLDISAMTLLEVEQQLLGRAARQGHRLALLQVLAVMVESLHHTILLRKSTQVVDFMVTLLQRACVGLDQATGPSLGNPVENQALSMGMGLVATMLSGPQLSAEDYSSMSRLLLPLEKLSQMHSEVVIQELASSLRAVIATHSAYRPEDLSTAAPPSRNSPVGKKQNMQTEADNSQSSPHSPPQDSTSQTNTQTGQPVSSQKSAIGVSQNDGGMNSGTSDPCPPTKAFSDLLLECCDQDIPTRAVALRILTQMVKNGNPEAVKAQEEVLQLLLENLGHEDSFVYLSAIQGLATLADSYPEKILEKLIKEFQHGPSFPKSNKEHSLEARLKVGEVLMRTSRAMGELAPRFGRPLVAILLQGTRDSDQSVRASSLSNLGELCQRLDYAVGPLAQELSSCLTALIKTEKEAEVRRAAVHVITLLLRGLSNRTTQVLCDVLLDLYRALKWVVRSDPDEVAVLHAQLALEELDDVMKRFIFPEQKLEKKIVVLP
ncbi:transport and Golgi organization protein 6 homolog isoform X2 [Acanthopagrus latus]|uniref:transport and Golgi organization protein 6 homolog isoform X2 n=1 Tax=Acanthopagrus latus TaxID=8177 RepID=UPI00187C2CB2|nr:transport and Golgi organization protein 6 homolog isoform X2 [Acanthopagrus latus]